MSACSNNQQEIENKLLENTIVELKVTADEFSYEAEKKRFVQDIKATITKSNTLKRGAEEKQQSLGKILAKKKVIMEKKI